ncbi:amidohydrolase [Streptomyces sp. LBL]|uniref:M20 metallopeptidase family protein n=1 Tax=Streptomyces sp. LBL TaxID=2940562 RepID=UPI002476E7B8|nr:amidohydrolase [Streptomyces sp. LBL]MDH6624412.1 amidohydrolase [Streptomyces sp. LBL]
MNEPTVDDLVLLRRIRRVIHRHPETAHREHRTAAYVERLLTRFGLAPFRPAPTSVAVRIGPSTADLVIGFRADLDALPIPEETEAPYRSGIPGVMHACGHDGHAAAVLTLGRRLAADPPRSHAVLLVFQQAEESHPSGAPLALQGLPADMRPPLFFGLHLWPELPTGVIGLRSGPLLASVAGITIRITGSQGRSHGTQAEAGGVDALNAGVLLYGMLPTTPAGRTLDEDHPHALHIGRLAGGVLPHRVPVECEIRGTLRALSESAESEALSQIQALAAMAAARTGAAIDVKVEQDIRPPLCNTESAVDLAAEACRATGATWRPYPPRPIGVSDDFGWYLKGADGAMLLAGCGTGPSPADLHTSRFDFDEQALLPIVDVFTWLAHNPRRSTR